VKAYNQKKSSICPHGVNLITEINGTSVFDQTKCVSCQLHWYKEGLARALKLIPRFQKKIHNLEKELNHG
jgi:hypothetical protein